MLMKPETVEKIVGTTIVLHNLLRLRKKNRLTDVDQEDANHNVTPADWRSDVQLTGITGIASTRSSTVYSRRQRNYLKNYFNDARGSVPWQHQMI